jgi:hypothetical protein
MSDQGSDILARECAVFCRYLIGQDPGEPVARAYVRAHESGSVTGGGNAGTGALDRALLRLARGGTTRARVADAYAAVFARASLFRRKIVLLVAILESRGPTSAALDTAVPGSRVLWIGATALQVVGGALWVAAGVLLVWPLRFWYTLAGARPRG